MGTKLDSLYLIRHNYLQAETLDKIQNKNMILLQNFRRTVIEDFICMKERSKCNLKNGQA